MIILGIQESHTCTAALMKDGEIVAAVSEERFSRRKGEQGFPKKAIRFCLQHIPEGRILDRVVLSVYDMTPENVMISRADKFNVHDHLRAQYDYFKRYLIDGVSIDIANKEFFGPLIENADISETNYLWDGFRPSFKQTEDIENFRNIRIETLRQVTGVDPDKFHFIDHHKCHAAYAYFASPFRGKEALVLTMDGIGEGKNATVSIAKDEKIDEVYFTNKCSIGRIWRYITLLLGMKPEEHEYKVMGLAPYAKTYMVNEVETIFDEHLDTDGMKFVQKKKLQDLYFYHKKLLEGYRFDAIAGAIQSHTEKIIQKWVKGCIKETGIHRVVFSGGVAMNIKVNKSIAEIPEVQEFFVAPSGGDESIALGGCYFENARNGGSNRPLKTVYLGPSFSDEDIERAIRGTGFQVSRGNTNIDLAKLLAEGNVIARCCSNSEFGARALGNRSILADPSKLETVERINNKIKFRDFWMPFTPTVLSEREIDYFFNPKKIQSPFMTVAFDTTELGAKHFKAAIHPHDKTIRPQVIKREHNPEYYDLIKEFEKITGIGGLLNTSLNLHGEPVVCSPTDAVHTFVNSDLDMLLMNDYLIQRSNDQVKS